MECATALHPVLPTAQQEGQPTERQQARRGEWRMSRPMAQLGVQLLAGRGIETGSRLTAADDAADGATETYGAANGAAYSAADVVADGAVGGAERWKL